MKTFAFIIIITIISERAVMTVRISDYQMLFGPRSLRAQKQHAGCGKRGIATLESKI